jgi:hypothetical protein
MSKLLLFLLWPSDVLSRVSLRIRHGLVVGELGEALSAVVHSGKEQIEVIRVPVVDSHPYFLKHVFGVALPDWIAPKGGLTWSDPDAECRHRHVVPRYVRGNLLEEDRHPNPCDPCHCSVY